MSRILVVEDEAAIAELISINLRHAGFEVTVAGDAEQAQAAVDGALPSLVVLDWMLPGQSGLALARRWRTEPRTHSLPIIMLTARAEESDKISGLDAGADDYLTKPFSANELLARIRALLRRRSPEALDEAVEVGALTHQSGDAPRDRQRPRGQDRRDRVQAAPFPDDPSRARAQPERSCSTGSGATTSSSRSAPWTSTSSACARPWPGRLPGMIETVRGAGYRLAQSHAAKA